MAGTSRQSPTLRKVSSPEDLLRKTQEDLMGMSEVAPVLLRLRLLASRLGSDLLEEWVRYESEGYPEGVEVPDYRSTGIHYTGTFANAAWIKRNVQIPPLAVERLAGREWVVHRMREPLAEIEHLIQRHKTNQKGNLTLGAAANLIPLLGDRVYDGMHCQGVVATIPDNALVNVQTVVRSRIMDLTIKLEAVLGDDGGVESGRSARSADYNRIVNSVIHGNVMIGSNVGGDITQPVNPLDVDALTAALADRGFGRPEASELATIVASETSAPGGSLGRKTLDWLTNRVDAVARPVVTKLVSDIVSGL